MSTWPLLLKSCSAFRTNTRLSVQSQPGWGHSQLIHCYWHILRRSTEIKQSSRGVVFCSYLCFLVFIVFRNSISSRRCLPNDGVLCGYELSAGCDEESCWEGWNYVLYLLIASLYTRCSLVLHPELQQRRSVSVCYPSCCSRVTCDHYALCLQR